MVGTPDHHPQGAWVTAPSINPFLGPLAAHASSPTPPPTSALQRHVPPRALARPQRQVALADGRVAQAPLQDVHNPKIRGPRRKRPAAAAAAAPVLAAAAKPQPAAAGARRGQRARRGRRAGATPGSVIWLEGQRPAVPDHIELKQADGVALARPGGPGAAPVPVPCRCLGGVLARRRGEGSGAVVRQLGQGPGLLASKVAGVRSAGQQRHCLAGAKASPQLPWIAPLQGPAP
jgi:hypothetical protein